MQSICTKAQVQDLLGSLPVSKCNFISRCICFPVSTFVSNTDKCIVRKQVYSCTHKGSMHLQRHAYTSLAANHTHCTPMYTQAPTPTLSDTICFVALLGVCVRQGCQPIRAQLQVEHACAAITDSAQCAHVHKTNATCADRNAYLHARPTQQHTLPVFIPIAYHCNSDSCYHLQAPALISSRYQHPNAALFESCVCSQLIPDVCLPALAALVFLPTERSFEPPIREIPPAFIKR